MVKRKAVRKTTRKVSVSKTRASSSRKKRNSSFNPMKAVVGGVIYGGVRQKVASLLEPITSKIPAGQYADEVVMGAISYFIAKGKIKFIPKEVGLAGLMIESAVIGQDIANGSFGGGFGTSNSTSTNGVKVL